MTSFVYQKFSELSHLMKIFSHKSSKGEPHQITMLVKIIKIALLIFWIKSFLRKWCGSVQDTQGPCVKSEKTWKLVFSDITKKLNKGGERNL